MNRFFSLILFFPVFFVLVLFASLAQYVEQASNEMQEFYVADAANVANDAAMWLAQATSSVDGYGRVTIDPDAIWTEYKRCFLRAMNLYSNITMDLFEAYCPATVLAVNDGYFVRLRTNTSAGEVEYKWSQKIPYARVVGDRVVADTMNGRYVYGFDLNNDTATVWGDNVPLNDLAGDASLHNTSLIAREILTAMDYCIELENSAITNNLWDTRRFYVPKELINTVYYDTVTFEGLSLLNLIQGFDLNSSKPIDYYTISNTQLVRAAQFVCYEQGSNRYYRPARLGVPTGTTLAGYAPGKVEAAKNGYGPDPHYYQVN